MTPSPTAVISSTPPPTPAPAAAPAPAPVAAPPSEDLAAIKAELASLKEQAAETKRTAEYWYEKATKGASAPAAAKPADEPEVDLLDVLTTKGTKGLKEILKQQGFASKEEVDSLVNSKAAQLTKEQELLGRYPDLKSKDSDFFKATVVRYGEMKKAGVPEHVAMELAAEGAELELIRTGKWQTPQQKAEAAAAARTADRAARAAAQAGDTGNRGSGEPVDDETLDADEQLAVRRLADALDLSYEKAEERYRARAKKGVQVSFKVGRK